MVVIGLKFVLYALLIVFFGWKLSLYAERLAEVKGLGKGLVGFILLGFATSLPELITTLSSVVFLGNPDLGAGNILGSENANMFILFISLLTASTLFKKNAMDRENLVSLAMFFVMNTLFLLAIVLDGGVMLFGKSVFSPLLIGFFLLSIVVLKNTNREEREAERKSESMSRFFYFLLSFFLLALVAVSFQLSVVVDEMATLTGWNSTSVGALFLAWATSLPELVVTISAMVLGASEMGIGNIVGSNIFNLMILAVADVVSSPGITLFKKNEKILFLTAILYLLSSTLFYMLSAKQLKKIFGISLLPAIMSLVYIVSMVVVFR